MSTDKKCYKCSETKPLEEFSKNKKSTGGYENRCRACTAAHVRSYYADNKEKIKATKPPMSPESNKKYKLLHRHKTTLAELIDQFGTNCNICKNDLDFSKLTHVDHDHNCCPKNKSCENCRRGLLSSKCNHGIGLFNDSPDLLLSARDYLIRNGGDTRAN